MSLRQVCAVLKNFVFVVFYLADKVDFFFFERYRTLSVSVAVVLIERTGCLFGVKTFPH